MVKSIALIGTLASCVLGFRKDLIKGLVSKGVKVYAFALDYDEVSKSEVRLLGAEPVDYTFSRSGLNPIADIVDTLKLAKLIKSIGPELVFCYFAKPVIFGTIAAKIAGVSRRIGMLEGLGYVFTDQPSGTRFKTKFLKAVQVMLYRIALPSLERLVLLNEDDQKDLVEKYKISVKKVSILGGIGLDISQYHYSRPPVSPITFIFIGRLLAEKGIHEFIAAAKKVKAECLDVTFVVLGGIDHDNPGALTEGALDEVINSGLITYPGHVEDVAVWLRSSSVFVLPSYREGMPRSTQEAMAIGRAVITSDVPGCRDTVEDGVNGFLVKPWSPDDIYSKMMFFVKNKDQVVNMGLASYRIAVSSYDVSLVNEKIYSYLK
ncbi:glycosyl transferase family 1 [Pseudomonas endophytica]|uniref:Glycosyl transferase family 1 n=1 Tax=Pseudomonas endophytica TaxID=1563157 RepID=A0A0Q0XX27_9PSED|nr:glycosyltransferase family 4 protein [Pseudomonas endophytica]KQB55307.1 glycosyl transferase family 1 [Pseudomonas endophytica]